MSTGCADTFLEQTPLDALSSETYFRTEMDLRNYNNGLYNQARDDEKIPIMDGLNIQLQGH